MLLHIDASTKGAKTRWKIENKCFNTLKNQGYHLSQNYGHGENHLSFNFYVLTLPAFLFHQIFEFCDPLFKECRKSHHSKRHLWETLRTKHSASLKNSNQPDIWNCF